MGLEPSGWASKGGLAIFDYSEPSEHWLKLSYTRRVFLASALGVLNRITLNTSSSFFYVALGS